jgi:hypothetical protein
LVTVYRLLVIGFRNDRSPQQRVRLHSAAAARLHVARHGFPAATRAPHYGGSELSQSIIEIDYSLCIRDHEPAFPLSIVNSFDYRTSVLAIVSLNSS